MIGLDTNVLVRYIVRDDEKQAAAATRLIEARCTTDNPGRVSSLVLCELAWVLTRGYGYSRAMVGRVIRRILSVQELQAERPELAWQAVRLFEQGRADFADFLVAEYLFFRELRLLQERLTAKAQMRGIFDEEEIFNLVS